MNQLGFLDQDGRALRDEGMQMAADKANRNSPGWGERAYNAILEYIARHNFRPFTAEDAQEWAYENGLNVPASNNAWGSVISRLARDGRITKTGIRNSRKANAHARTVIVWTPTKSHSEPTGSLRV